MLDRIVRGLRWRWRKVFDGPIVLLPPGQSRGRALLSYLTDPFLGLAADGLPGHSNRWESREIGRLLAELGYIVDVIDYRDTAFVPRISYDVIIDIATNLQRLAPLVSPRTKKLLHLTSSYGPFQNQAEVSRVAEFERRTGKLYSPKRLVENLELVERSLRLADRCSLIGNQEIVETYPEKYRHKITPVPVSASRLHIERDISKGVPAEREFLWFFGSGAVHKGLDLVLEVFQRRPLLKLHIVADLESEPDFLAAANAELCLPNVQYHGRLNPDSAEFSERIKSVFCFIAPSCSEGMSPAVVTCMQFGLYPIISRQTGVSLPQDGGILLRNLTADSISNAIDEVLALSEEELVQKTRACQKHAKDAFSREEFTRKMGDYLRTSII